MLKHIVSDKAHILTSPNPNFPENELSPQELCFNDNEAISSQALALLLPLKAESYNNISVHLVILNMYCFGSDKWMILQKLNATSELAHANDTNVLSVDKCIPVQSCRQQKMESVIKKK